MDNNFMLTPTCLSNEGECLEEKIDLTQFNEKNKNNLLRTSLNFTKYSSSHSNDIFLFLLECIIKNIDDGKNVFSNQWCLFRNAGLGPFIFIYVKRVMTINGDFFFVIQQPNDIPSPHFLQFFSSNINENKEYKMLFNLRYVGSIPLRNYILKENYVLEEFMFTINGETVIINKMNKFEKSLLTHSYDSAEESEKIQKEKKKTAQNYEYECVDMERLCMENKLLFQVLFLKITSIWSERILQHCGLLNDIVSICQREDEIRCLLAPIKAICFLRQFLCDKIKEEEEESNFDVVNLFAEWASVMHKTFLVSTSCYVDVNNNNNNNNDNSTEIFISDEKKKRRKKEEEEEEEKKNNNNNNDDVLFLSRQCQLQMSSAPFFLKDAKDGQSCDKNEVKTRETKNKTTLKRDKCSQLYYDMNKGKKYIGRRKNIYNNNNKWNGKKLKFMSVCSEAIEEAFSLQERKGKKKRVGQQTEDEEKKEERRCSNVSGLEDRKTCVDNLAAFNNISQTLKKDESTLYSDGDNCTNDSGSYVSSLLHRLAVKCSASSDNSVLCELLAIAKGDYFPSLKMITKLDLLRQRSAGTSFVVGFYDLDPRTTEVTNRDAVKKHSNSGLASPSSGFCGVSHPCSLFITQTDIILCSELDDINPIQRCISTPSYSFSIDMPQTGGGDICVDTDSANDDNDDINKSLAFIKRVFVIPRVSLVEICRLFDFSDENTPAVLCLQTQSCRRLWLEFRTETALHTAYAELTGVMNTSVLNRFLESAKRPWRMAALTLIAGDILPFSQTPFYQQVLQNLTVAFADVELRRVQISTVDPNINLKPVTTVEEKKSSSSPHWWLYSVETEYARQGVPARLWRFSDVNSHYENFPSYPARLLVPNSVNDDMLLKSAELRVRRRVHALSYYHLATGAGIFRTSQPSARCFFCQYASRKDGIDTYQYALERACGMQQRVFDLRSCINAFAHVFVGGGFGLQKGKFCYIDNIHKVRHAYQVLCAEIVNNNPSFLTAIKASNAALTQESGSTTSGAPLLVHEIKGSAVWLDKIYVLLQTAINIARLVAGLSEDEALLPVFSSTTSSRALSGVESNYGNVTGTYISSQSHLGHLLTRAFSVIPFGGDISLKLQQWRWRFLHTPSLPPPPPSYMSLQNGKNARLVVVNCSDGWDRTPQVCALAEILLDPYYRTVEGFIILLEKEFVSFGHPSLLRSTTLKSHSNLSAGDCRAGVEGCVEDDGVLPSTLSQSQSSPIILQFLDAVHQLIRLYPHCFEFTEAFLLLIVDIMHAGIVGTFAVNCEKDIYSDGVDKQTLSLSQFFAVLFATTLSSTSNSSFADGDNKISDSSNSNCDCSSDNISDGDDDNNTLGAVGPIEDCALFSELISNYNNSSSSSSNSNNNTNDINNTSTTMSSSFFSFSSSSSFTPFVSLRTFYQYFCGGFCVDNSQNIIKRRLYLTNDAMCFSGLLNPNFSFLDNKLLFGPLLDKVERTQLALWESFFLRYNFIAGRLKHLRQFSEQKQRSSVYLFTNFKTKKITKTRGINVKSKKSKIIKMSCFCKKKQKIDEQGENYNSNKNNNQLRLTKVMDPKNDVVTVGSVLCDNNKNDAKEKNRENFVLNTTNNNGGIEKNAISHQSLKSFTVFSKKYSIGEANTDDFSLDAAKIKKKDVSEFTGRMKGYATLLDSLDQAFKH